MSESREEEYCVECSSVIKYNEYTCDKCDILYCDECDDEYLTEVYISCKEDDCLNCKVEYCFNDRHYKRCPNCIDDEFEAIIQQEKEYEEQLHKEYEKQEQRFQYLKSTKSERKKVIIKALSDKGVELRTDSNLCKKYINQDEGDLYEIVERMCELKYLYEYCDMRKELRKVEHDHIETLNAGYYPDCSVFQEAEDNIIRRLNGYPSKYPWQH